MVIQLPETTPLTLFHKTRDGTSLERPDGHAQITLWHLATHTSGLPSNPGNVDAFQKYRWTVYSAEDLYAGLRQTVLSDPPGMELVYSNLGMGLLGHLLSVAAKKPYEVLLEEQVFGPLHMSSTGPATRINARQRDRWAVGYETATAAWRAVDPRFLPCPTSPRFCRCS